jgi:pyruvate dehydrogenase E2 component (dihydrolipoyllysine-residue acetyltransferase)
MAISVVMPALELAQETGKVVAWRKKEGESVAKGEPLLEIETDKAVVEIESPGDGILSGVSANVGDVIPVGTTIGWLLHAGESVPAEAAGSHSTGRTKTESAPRVQARESAVAKPAAGAVKISPKARRFAQERGVDIEQLRGSGPGGEILASDILAAAGPAHADATKTANATSAEPGVEVLSSVGRLMAERTTQSWVSVPHFFVVREIDATGLNQFRERTAGSIEKAAGSRPTHTDLLIALVARALSKHPRLNACWTGSGIRSYPEVNIGVAMAVKDGVVAAVIPNADRASVSEIAAQRRELTERARAGRSRPADISGATFTISNLGMYNVDAFTAIISPGQAAILAVGSIADRVVAVDGKAAICPMMTLTLSCDHRVADGARAAMFLDDVAAAIRDPAKLLERPPTD